MNLADELKRRRAIVDAASGGTWYVTREGSTTVMSSGFESGPKSVAGCAGLHNGPQNAAFIAHARTGYAETLAALERAVDCLQKCKQGVGVRAALAEIAAILEGKG